MDVLSNMGLSWIFSKWGWGVGGGVSTYIVHKIVPSLNPLVSVANFNAATP